MQGVAHRDGIRTVVAATAVAAAVNPAAVADLPSTADPGTEAAAPTDGCSSGAIPTTSRGTVIGTITTDLSGRTLLNDAALNHGTAFTQAERDLLGLHGLLPAHLETIDDQLARVDATYHRLHDDLERHIFLRALQDTNEVLLYRYLTDHLTALLPIVDTPTVGAACEQFSHIYRRPHGLFVDADHLDDLDGQLAAVRDDIDVLVVTDGERILGLGDQGLGGMGIPIGKLSLYTAVGGIDPRRTLPVLLDVGTNNRDLLDDPLYLGARHERLTGQDYLDVVDRFIDVVRDLYPGALLQWEDVAQHHATQLLERHRDRVLSFNDDIQGTAAVALAAVQAGVAANGDELSHARVVIVGAGSAGTGIAGMLTGAGLPAASLFLVDADGLLHDRRGDLASYQTPFAQRWETVAPWADHDGPTSLEQVVTAARPTVLVGVSGQPGLFTEPIVRPLTQWSDHPVILPLSNPTDRAEATPTDLLHWTSGRALVATGSPFDDVELDGRRHTIAQSNAIDVFPGLGAGALAAGATAVTDAMLRAVAAAVADTSPCPSGAASDGLLPPLSDVVPTSRRIALAVAGAARAEGVGDDVDDTDLDARLRGCRWTPEYPQIYPR